MSGCRYPQRRNSKTGRCKKPCKKSQKVNPKTGRCVLKRRCSKPSRKRKRKYCRKSSGRERMPLYYDGYIPSYGNNKIEYDTDDNVFFDPVDPTAPSMTNTMKIEQEDELFKTAQFEEPKIFDNVPEPLTSTIQRKFDSEFETMEDTFKSAQDTNVSFSTEDKIKFNILNDESRAIAKGIASAAYAAKKNVLGVLEIQRTYPSCSPEKDIGGDVRRNLGCGILDVMRYEGMGKRNVGQKDYTDWVYRVSRSEKREVMFYTMYGREIGGEEMTFVLNHAKEYGMFDTIFLFKDHLWRIKSGVQDVDRYAAVMKFDRIVKSNDPDYIVKRSYELFGDDIVVNHEFYDEADEDLYNDRATKFSPEKDLDLDATMGEFKMEKEESSDIGYMPEGWENQPEGPQSEEPVYGNDEEDDMIGGIYGQ